jgi:hypothetical protein
MPDNIQVTAGTGTTIAADDISGVLHQRVKLTWGADGTANDASASSPLPVVQTGALPAGSNALGSVSVTSGSVALSSAIPTGANTIGSVGITGALPAGSNALGSVSVSSIAASEIHLGEVGGRTIVSNASITRPADTVAYASGDAIADSTSAPTVFTFSNAARINQGSGVIIGAMLVDSANQATKGDFDLLIFDTTYTPNNDNAVFTPTNAEMESCVGVVRFSSSNFVTGNAAAGASGNALCLGTLTDNIGFKCGSGSTSLFARLVTRSAYTPVSGKKFTIRLRILQD